MTQVNITTEAISSLTGSEQSQPLSRQQSDLSKLFAELSVGNEKALDGVDLDQYVEVDGKKILLSLFLINMFLNPDVEGGDDAIRMIMEKKPDLDRMMMPEGEQMSARSFLEMMRQVFIDNKAPGMSTEECAIVVGRIDIALRG